MKTSKDEYPSRQYVPKNESDAIATFERLTQEDLGGLPREDFLHLWYALAYLNPGLHPDGYELNDSGWTPQQRPLAQEAWSRATHGELSDEELYPTDAAWAGIYDQLPHPPASAHTRRRTHLRGHCHRGQQAANNK